MISSLMPTARYVEVSKANQSNTLVCQRRSTNLKWEWARLCFSKCWIKTGMFGKQQLIYDIGDRQFARDQSVEALCKL